MAQARRGKRKPKEEPLPLSRERICREALALVDEEGLDALSMRRLGARLGVEAMSLYRHVRDKRDLLDALHAAVIGDLQPAGEVGGECWRQLLGGLARALRNTLLLHPNVVVLFATRPVSAPEAVGTLEIVWAALEHAGFSPDDARRAVVVVGLHTIGHVLGETQGEASPIPGVPGPPGPAEFDFGLEALLDGIARKRESPLP
jgi:AcrR family transcriptional regulator